MLSKIDVAHLHPDTNVYVALYQDVANSGFLREQLVQGNADFEFAFIDAKSILSPTHLLAAVFRAVNDMGNGRMKSRNVHSEIVFCLNANNNIAESFRSFGVTDKTRDLLVVKISSEEPTKYQKLLDDSVQGRALHFNAEHVARTADESRIRKIYKLPQTKDGSRTDLELDILGIMALRGATN